MRAGAVDLVTPVVLSVAATPRVISLRFTDFGAEARFNDVYFGTDLRICDVAATRRLIVGDGRGQQFGA